jgi:U5 small nuclear ribonucleoprotein component
VLGEAYTPEDEEDSAVAEATAIWAPEARYRIPLARAPAGSLVLVEGLGAYISRTATVVAEACGDDEDVYVFRPLRFQTIRCEDGFLIVWLLGWRCVV